MVRFGVGLAESVIDHERRRLRPTTENAMISKTILTIAATVVASSMSHSAMAQTPAAPLTRSEVKAQARAAEKRHQIPAGEESSFQTPSTKSTKTRSERKGETLAARKSGTLEAAGDADESAINKKMQSQPTTVNRAALKAETRAAERAGRIPSGEAMGGPGK
jgi:hypothetical protein